MNNFSISVAIICFAAILITAMFHAPKTAQCIQLNMNDWSCKTVDGRTDYCVQFEKDK